MSGIELSISDREAEEQYPTQYWEGTKTKPNTGKAPKPSDRST